MIHISKLNPFFVKELQTSWEILNYKKSGKLDKLHLKKCLDSYDFIELDLDSIFKNETLSKEYFTFGDFVNLLFTQMNSKIENLSFYFDITENEDKIEIKTIFKLIDIYLIDQPIEIIKDVKNKFDISKDIILLKELEEILK